MVGWLVVVRLVREWTLWNGCMHFDITVTLAYTKYKKAERRIYDPARHARSEFSYVCPAWMLVVALILLSISVHVQGAYYIKAGL